MLLDLHTSVLHCSCYTTFVAVIPLQKQSRDDSMQHQFAKRLLFEKVGEERRGKWEIVGHGEGRGALGFRVSSKLLKRFATPCCKSHPVALM